MPEQRQSALTVLAPDAEPAVAAWRRRLDPSAALGVPAHVTVLHPFVPPEDITQATRERIAALFAAEPPFEMRLEQIGWFRDAVAYCAPEPGERFRRLIGLVTAQWPEHPPYGGEHREVVPHLTIGQNAPVAELERAAADVARALPIRQRVDAVHLMIGDERPGSWAVTDRFPLGGTVA